MRILPICIAALAACVISSAASAQTRTIRVVSYNIEADIDGYTNARPGLVIPSVGGTVQQGGVLEGIGEETVGRDPAQPIDILALQETTSNAATVAPIVNALNSFYNTPGRYAMSTYQATESGGYAASGNGPNAMIYNSKTVQLLASVPVDPPGGSSHLGSQSGEFREVMRYEFAPADTTPTSANEFYVYVSHYKSGSSSSDLTARNGEAQIIRNDEADNLPADASVLYVGDYNITTSAEASYRTILALTAPDGTAQGQGIDPMNPYGSASINWGTYTTDPNILAMETWSPSYLHYRDDYQIMTTNVYYGQSGRLALVPETYHVFGNNGTTPFLGRVDSGSNTSLNNNLVTNGPVFITASQLYTDLIMASDHFPVVADYTIPVEVPAPEFLSVTASDGTITLTWSAVSNANYQVQYISDLAQTNWTDLDRIITATNSVMSTSESVGPDAQRFYRLVVQ